MKFYWSLLLSFSFSRLSPVRRRENFLNPVFSEAAPGYLVYFRISKTLDFSYSTRHRFNSTAVKHRRTFALLALKIHSSIARARGWAPFASRRANPTVNAPATPSPSPPTGCFEHFAKFMTAKWNASSVERVISPVLTELLLVKLFRQWKPITR